MKVHQTYLSCFPSAPMYFSRRIYVLHVLHLYLAGAFCFVSCSVQTSYESSVSSPPKTSHLRLSLVLPDLLPQRGRQIVGSRELARRLLLLVVHLVAHRTGGNRYARFLIGEYLPEGPISRCARQTGVLFCNSLKFLSSHLGWKIIIF